MPGFKHPLWACVQERISDEAIIALYKKVRAGDDKAEHDLIHANLRFGLFLVTKYTGNSVERVEGIRNLRVDDLVSEMLVALVGAVRKLKKGAIDNHQSGITINGILGYISWTITGALNNLITRGTKGQFEMFIKTEKADIDHGMSCKELEEVIYSCVKDEREKQIIDMRMTGMTDLAISKDLGYSETYIWAIRTNVAKRITERLKCP